MKELIVCADVAHEYNGHPAKLHQDVARQLILDYSNGGDRVLDPFAGIGTVPRVARRLGRVGIGIEVEPRFVERANELGTDLFLGDCSKVAPTLQPVQLILTSPPYGDTIGRSGDRNPHKTALAKQRYEEKRFGRVITKHATYGQSAGNLGALPFRRKHKLCFESAMPAVVSKVVPMLEPGGRAVFVVKDQRLGRRRLGAVDLFSFFRQCLESAGLVYEHRRVVLLPERMTTLHQRNNLKRWNIPIPNCEHVVVARLSK